MKEARPVNIRFLLLSALILSSSAFQVHAYYHPDEGRWISRDPIEERGWLTVNGPVESPSEDQGEGKLYAYVLNGPINAIDPFGLAFYAVDGTWSGAGSVSNPRALYQATSERPDWYWPGPILGGTGMDAYSLRSRVYNQICKAYCEATKNCQKFPINMTGWSRGAVVVMGVAERLNSQGCTCRGSGAVISITTRPIKVNWIGLFDAVKMIPAGGWPTSVPGNVQSFAHAIKTKHSIIFRTVHYGGNERSFSLNDGRLSTHHDIGVDRSNNGASDWIKSQAVSAGVAF